MEKGLWLKRKVFALCTVALLLVVGMGCSHVHSRQEKVTGSPEALEVVARLKTMNDDAVPISGVFVYETTQDEPSRFAEYMRDGSAPAEFRGAPKRGESEQEVLNRAIRDYQDKKSKQGEQMWFHKEAERHELVRQGELFRDATSWTADGKEERPSTILAWNGRLGVHYEPGQKWGEVYRDRNRVRGVANVRTFSWRMAVPAVEGHVTTRREVVDGRELIVLRSEDAFTSSGDVLRREYYLDPQEQLVPRRIVQRLSRKAVATTRNTTVPSGELTFSEEYDVGLFRGGRHVRTWIVPAAVMTALDYGYNQCDSDTMIQAYVKRPDGKWFVTQSTTYYPFSHRTEKFTAEKVLFTPVPASAFDVQLPADARISR